MTQQSTRTERGIVSYIKSRIATKNTADWEIAGAIYILHDIFMDKDSIPSEGAVFGAIAQMKLPGFSHPPKVKSYYLAYTKAMSEGIVKHLVPGDLPKAPSTTFEPYLIGTPYQKKKVNRKLKRQEKASVVPAVESHIEASTQKPEPRSPYQKRAKATEFISTAAQFARSANKYFVADGMDENARNEMARQISEAQQALLELQSKLFAGV